MGPQLKVSSGDTMNGLIRTNIGLPFLLGWCKEVDIWESYTALPRGLIMWDIFDHEIHNKDII